MYFQKRKTNLKLLISQTKPIIYMKTKSLEIYVAMFSSIKLFFTKINIYE
jgi:hypothetical protein